jgi:hypothetical protein
MVGRLGTASQVAPPLVEVQAPPPTRATSLLKSADDARQVEPAKGAELDTQVAPESVEVYTIPPPLMFPTASSLEPSAEETTELQETR